MLCLYFSMPVKIEKRIDKLRRNLFVQGSKDKKSFNLVIRWNTLVINKKDGGMGIKNLRQQRLANEMTMEIQHRGGSFEGWSNQE